MKSDSCVDSAASGRLPLWLKLAYTAFVAVMVPVYWRTYGPTNFLYFCDVAVFLTLAAVWTENALLASMAAVGIVLPQILWVVDLTAHLFGLKITGMSDYMLNSNIPKSTRAISLFHGWLPFFLLYVIWRVGYDRRALRAWLALALPLMLICYFWLPKPGAVLANPQQPVNINYVYGFTDHAPQPWMPAWTWLLVLMAAMPLVFWWPAHLALKRWWPRAKGDGAVR
jgi:hypothetical protein